MAGNTDTCRSNVAPQYPRRSQLIGNDTHLIYRVSDMVLAFACN